MWRDKPQVASNQLNKSFLLIGAAHTTLLVSMHSVDFSIIHIQSQSSDSCANSRTRFPSKDASCNWLGQSALTYARGPRFHQQLIDTRRNTRYRLYRRIASLRITYPHYTVLRNQNKPEVSTMKIYKTLADIPKDPEHPGIKADDIQTIAEAQEPQPTSIYIIIPKKGKVSFQTNTITRGCSLRVSPPRVSQCS